MEKEDEDYICYVMAWRSMDHQALSANTCSFSVQVQGTNIRHYYSYVLSRAKAFQDTKIDWVREGQGRLKKLTVDKGLLRETESVQTQINALLKCDVSEPDPLFADLRHD